MAKKSVCVRKLEREEDGEAEHQNAPWGIRGDKGRCCIVGGCG